MELSFMPKTKKQKIKNKLKYAADIIGGELICGGMGAALGPFTVAPALWNNTSQPDEKSDGLERGKFRGISAVFMAPICSPLTITLGPCYGFKKGIHVGKRFGLKEGIKIMIEESFANIPTVYSYRYGYHAFTADLAKKKYLKIKVKDSDDEENQVAKTSIVIASVCERDDAMQRRGKEKKITFFSTLPPELCVHIATMQKITMEEGDARKIAEENYKPLRFAKY